MIFIDAFFSFAAGGRHHLAVMRLFGNFVAVIRRRCRGYSVIALRLLGINLALMRLLGNCVAVIGHHLAVMRLFGPVGPVRLVGHVGLRDGVCAPKRESGSLGRVLWWA